MQALPSAETEAHPWGRSDDTVGALLAERARRDGEFIYCRDGGHAFTVGRIERDANRVANALVDMGLRKGDRVLLMLANSADHIALFFALAKLGACQVCINVHLRGDALAHIVRDAEPAFVVAEADYAGHLSPLLAAVDARHVVWRGGTPAGVQGVDLQALIAHENDAPVDVRMRAGDLAAIIYTSGTTGLPKGVLVTDRMLRVSAWAAVRESAVRDGDVLHMWEPFYHIGGSEVLVLAVQKRVTLALVPKLSVSALWSEVREHGATHVHFLGGILALLLAQPPRPDDRDHSVRVAWGGGCPAHVWTAFEQRFGVKIHDSYGMTECCSFATQNLEGVPGSIGKPLPYLDLSIVDDEGRALGPGQVGEIWIREKVPGILSAGYWRNAEATEATFHGGVLRTGDLASFDERGFFRYVGRKKDSLRRMGENISAAEVEGILNEHPDIAESAVIGVPNAIADEDVKALIRAKASAVLDPLDLIKWCEGRMAYFQVPRYVEFVEDFPRTPSERIRKEMLSRDTTGCWDLARSGYALKRQ